MIRCVTDYEEDMISLSFRVVDDSDIMLFLCTLFAVILATTTILVAIVMIIRRYQRKRNKLTVVCYMFHGTCPESDDKVTSRRSLPSVPAMLFKHNTQPASEGEAHAKMELRQVWRNYVGLLLELPDNKNILQTLGICYQNENIYVTHHYEDTVHYWSTCRLTVFGDLDIMQRKCLRPCSQQPMIFWYGILTSHKCCHPGLCTQNILVDDQNTCKLYDFCKQEDASSVIEQFHIEKDQHLRITLPPEALLLGEYNSASDIWAIGVCCGLYFLMIGTDKECWSTRVAKRPSIFSVVKTLRSGSSSILKEIRNGNINPLDLVPVHFPTTPCREAACPTNVSVTVTTHQDESPSQEHYERVLYKDTSGD
ncbi:putative fibroblast growth factor receptor 1-A-like [Apostichopus japonicus]|uniref:Putative fibroblast growth factor receptor 1-A-like n=1 Tax=Stichopus japonicus TaxID=307972 RepID=A0A2G8KQW6_STIJA|nr:putative fibroblast growth factor receptor 1-A-like [Apostichopus japonicus]